MLQAGNSRPQQRHGTGNMRSCHGGAVQKEITAIAGVGSGANTSARSSNIRLGAVAAISGHGTPTAEAGYRIGAIDQSSHCVRSFIKRRRI